MEKIDPVSELAAIVESEGLRPAGRRLRCSPQYLCEVLKGRTLAGPKILDALGIERVVSYKRKKAK